MVGDLAGDDLRLVHVAAQLVVVAGHLQRGLDGLRAAAGEEHAVEVAGGELGDLRGQLDRRRVRVGPVRVEAQLAGLVGARLGDVLAAVADVHAEQRAEPVEVALALVVPDVAAVALDDHRDLVLLAVGAHAAEVQPQMTLGELLQATRSRGGARRHELSFSNPSGH